MSITSAQTPSSRKVALITGISGQDGSYLAELLLEKGYTVHGIIRRASSFNTTRIDHLFSKLKLHYGDLTDSTNLACLMNEIKPTEVYNLGAQSHVKVSFEMPEYTADVDAMGTLRLLDAIRSAGLTQQCKFYQASTSELFGLVQEPVQKETTPFYPRSPYACAKLFSYWIVRNYREAYGMHASNGILFNHESPRRGPTFVTRKITRHVARVSTGHTTEPLLLGNIHAMRDWGHAKDYVQAMWMMLQLEKPDDFVIATGETHTVKEAVERSYGVIGITIKWEGEGVNEVGKDAANGKVMVKIDPQYFRPTEVELLLGDPAKAKKTFGWSPLVTFPELMKEMVLADIEFAKKGDIFS